MQGLDNSLGSFADRIQPQDVFKSVSASMQLTPKDKVVLVQGTEGAVTITLPPVGECAGCVFSIVSLTGDTHNATVTHAGDSQGWANQVITKNGGGVLLWCDGRRFWPLSADLTS